MARTVKSPPMTCAQRPIPALHPTMASSVISVEESREQTEMTRIRMKLFSKPRKTALRIFFVSPPSPSTAWGTEKKADMANMARP